MSSDKIVLIAMAVVAVTSVLVAGRPNDAPIRFLADVAKKTMCPIKVVIDDNPNRVPRRIKFLKCDENPSRMCMDKELVHGCCQRHHHNYLSECVELYDWVQVTYKGSGKPDTIKVPVGCSCMIEESTTAKEIS